MTSLYLKPGREKSIFYRHPWIFSGALTPPTEKISDGEIIDVLNDKGQFVARGYYNYHSDIIIRILTFDEKEIVDVDFFVRKIKVLERFREPFVAAHNVKWGSPLTAYRLVFAESDGLPGLIVDRYNNGFVFQIHTLGMEWLKPLVVKAFIQLFHPDFIYERSDVDVRRKEGLSTFPKGLLYGKLPSSLIIEEAGLKFLVDIENGQKTGFFLDQRDNRAALRPYVKGKKVLNLFCYSGGFSCHALAALADKVISVDISSEAMALVEDNIQLNKLEEKKHEAVIADVFDYLENAKKLGETFDVVIVDPPAFVKSRASLQNALQAYVRLNAAALQVLKKGGMLISSSCSSYVSPELFRGVLFQAALRVKTDLTIVEQHSQPFDHPLSVYFPEGEYLKFFIAQKR